MHRFSVATLSVAILFVSFAALPQSKRGGAASRTVRVRQIDVPKLKRILARRGPSAKPLLVNFWATWCDPCREEFPDLVQVDKDFRRRGLEFITVSLDESADIKTLVPKFLREMKSTMPAYLLLAPEPEDIIKAVDKDWNGGLPATFLYNAKGEIVFKHTGRLKTNELRAALEQLLPAKKTD